jgi:transcription elongation factor S-II
LFNLTRFTALIRFATLQETKAGLAIGKLRSHPRKEIAELAKELVKKWKEAVEAGKKAKVTTGTGGPAPAADAGQPSGGCFRPYDYYILIKRFVVK